jgi:hypothetical protein
MIVDRSSLLPCDPQTVIAHVKTPKLLHHVAHPLLKFVPSDPERLPDTWSEGTYWMSLRLLGVIPMGKQAVVIRYPDAPDAFRLVDHGHSALIKRWHHVITVEATGNGTHYRDRVTIDAGWLTPMIWLFAQFFFRHRQRRLRALASRGFRYADA